MTTRTLNLPHNITITVEQPYAEGHVLTQLEAEKLNHIFADNIRTSLMSKLKRADDGISANDLELEFQNYANNYSFAPRSTKTAADPVAKEANKIAKEQVFSAIRKKGGNPADYTAEQIADYVAKVLDHKPEIRQEAARRIESSRKLAGDLLADIFDEAA
jgi:hypothetical protein